MPNSAKSFLRKYPSARPITAPSCPCDKGVAFEIVTTAMYQSEGDGHLLVVGFAEQSPDCPSLLFERSDAPPKANSGDKVTAYRPTEKLHRLPGTLYSVVELDSNASIFEKAAATFSTYLSRFRLIELSA